MKNCLKLSLTLFLRTAVYPFLASPLSTSEGTYAGGQGATWYQIRGARGNDNFQTQAAHTAILRTHAVARSLREQTKYIENKYEQLKI